MEPPRDESRSGALARELGLPGAVLLGLGSIVGTGVFVSLGIAAGVAGSAVLLAIPLAAVVALLNGLSSAQLAAAHPVSGGTYEYGYRLLSPAWGFSAGWTFLLAKSASAATAALGLAGYLLGFLAGGIAWDGEYARLVPIALVGVVVLTVIVAGGIRRSNRANAVIVSLTLAAFAFFLVVGLYRVAAPAGVEAGAPPPIEHLTVLEDLSVASLLHATALLFVAYTGYGRIATLGEEVRDPARTIPRAVVGTLAVVFLLYLGVTFVAVATVGAPAFAAATGETAAPLLSVAEALRVPLVATVLSVAAVTAMVGVLLNLILGLSRVGLAMARRGDLPGLLARVPSASRGPVPAVLATGALVAALVLVGDVRVTWSFSAFTVLVYYAVTNLAALRLPPEARRYPPWVPGAGLVGCLGVAFWVEPAIWLAGLGLLAAGLLVHLVMKRRGAPAGRV